MDSLNYPEGSAAALYEARVTDRAPFVKRAEEASKLTIPSLFPPNGATGATTLHSPFQSVGARGMNNLASKMVLTLLPPNAPCFRFAVDQLTLDEVVGEDPEAKTEVDETFNKIENTATTALEETTIRTTAPEMFNHLLAAGNALFHFPDDGQTRMYPLNQFVVKRASNGTVLDIITKETKSKSELTEKQLELIRQHIKPEEFADLKTLFLYTQCKRCDTKWEVHQELSGIDDPDTHGNYPLDACAFIPVRFRKVDGQDYGRSFIEEIIGDLRSLEGLEQSMVEAAAGLAKMLVLVDPNGVTSKKTISQSPNLAVRDGRKDDVSFLQSDKAVDLNWARQQADKIEGRLTLSFLLNSAVQRQAERVTAEEIRYVALELEAALGGIYAILGLEFQMPLVKRQLNLLQKNKKNFPILDDKVVKPVIITGLDALGRGHEVNRLDNFTNGVKELVGPENLDTYINVPNILKKRAIAVGVEANLVRSPKEAQQIQQQRQAAALAEKAAPNAVTQYGSYAREQQQSTSPAPSKS